MQVIRQIEAARFSGAVLTIGNFDGVHRGHRALLDKALELARASGGEFVVMTFAPHPAAVLSPDRVPPTLTPLHEKLRLLEAAGANAAVTIASRPKFFHLSAEDFIREIIVARFHPVALVEGEDFHFGRHRQGDSAMLRAAGRQHGFELHTVEPVRAGLGGHPDTVISSSLVRHLLSSGNVDRAAACLGRAYALFGTVRPGAGRGRELGFPTANLIVESQLIPAEGVYAGVAAVLEEEGGAGGEGQAESAGFRVPGSVRGGTDGRRDQATQGRNPRFPAAISIGRTPTFAGHNLLVEAHLLDFRGNLYGRTLRVDFLDWLRGQERFADADALQQQIARDVARVREITGDQPAHLR